MNQTQHENVTPPNRPAPPGGTQVAATLNANRLGLATGLTGVVFYLGCMIFLAVVPRQSAIAFSNSLLHGVDVTSIWRPHVPISEVALGIFSWFVLGWIAGALIAAFYDWGLQRKGGAA